MVLSERNKAAEELGDTVPRSRRVAGVDGGGEVTVWSKLTEEDDL